MLLMLLHLGVALLDLLLDRLFELLVLLRLTLALIVTGSWHIPTSTPPELVVVLEVPQGGAECGTGLFEVNELASRGVFGLRLLLLLQLLLLEGAIGRLDHVDPRTLVGDIGRLVLSPLDLQPLLGGCGR